MRTVARRSQTYGDYLKSEHWRKTRLRKLLTANLRNDPAAVQCEHCKLWFLADYDLLNDSPTADFAGINIHHKTYHNLHCEPLNDLSVLCESCHGVEHGWGPTYWWQLALEDRERLKDQHFVTRAFIRTHRAIKTAEKSIMDTLNDMRLDQLESMYQ